MRQRWLPAAVLAGGLFAVNALARVLARFAVDEGSPWEDRIGWGSMVAIALVMAVTAFVWGRHRPAGPVLGDLAVAVLASGLFVIIVGPFISGGSPFANGAGEFFTQIGIYVAVTGGGAGLGLLVLIALGLDYRSQSLKRFAEAKLAKPRRVVRR